MFEYIAPCHFGLEAVCKREIYDLGYDVTRVEDGKVFFRGDAEAGVRANIFLRTAERILLEVGTFTARTWDELFEGTKALPWEDYLAALEAGEYDLYYAEVRLGADWDLTELLGTEGSLNYSHWSTAQTEALLDACRSSPDPAAGVKALCTYLQSQVPILPICFKSTSVLTQAGVAETLQPTAANPFYRLPDCIFRLQGGV